MKRYHSICDRRIRDRRRQQYITNELSQGSIKTRVELEKEVSKKNMRNKHPYDCGVAKCPVCHYEKLLKLKRKEEIIWDEREREQLAEMDEESLNFYIHNDDYYPEYY